MYYIISVDVGRKKCDTVLCVLKVIPRGKETKALISLVNIWVMPADTHFEDQAIAIKKFYYKYNARRVIIDANGLITQSRKLEII